MLVNQSFGSQSNSPLKGFDFRGINATPNESCDSSSDSSSKFVFELWCGNKDVSPSSSSSVDNDNSIDNIPSPVCESTKSDVKQVGFRLLANGKDNLKEVKSKGSFNSTQVVGRSPYFDSPRKLDSNGKPKRTFRKCSACVTCGKDNCNHNNNSDPDLSLLSDEYVTTLGRNINSSLKGWKSPTLRQDPKSKDRDS